MIKVVSYIETSKTEKFKKFLAKPFTIDMLYPIFSNNSGETLFDDWHGKDMGEWQKFTNDNKIILEFYRTHYIIKKTTDSIKILIPKTINEFISDMFRFNIEIYWMPWIDLNFEPKDYLHRDQIKSYFINLLTQMGKSHELL